MPFEIIQKSEGSVHIHCLGGEHRTEIIFEVMQKCFNKALQQEIVDRYHCHTGWINAENTGSSIQDNLDFIEDFPCSMIGKSQPLIEYHHWQARSGTRAPDFLVLRNSA